MKFLFFNIFVLGYLLSQGQSSIGEIADKSIQQRVLLIRQKTDSFLNKAADKNISKKFVADFGVTYQKGEFYGNYLLLNKWEEDPNNIYDLTQYYSLNDKNLGVSDTIGVYYLELKNEYVPETNRLEVRFKSNEDHLKVKALGYLYKAATQDKLKRLIKLNKLQAPFVKIEVHKKSNTYFVLLKSKNKPHNYPL